MIKRVRKDSKFVMYKITHVDSGKMYIGITINYKRRMNEHFYKDNNSYIHRAIMKYGKENFSHEIICRCRNWDDLCDKEIKFIKLFNTKRPYGYNLTNGGDGILGLKHLKKTKQKISEGNKNPSKKTLERMSNASRGFSTEQIIEIKQRLFNGISQHKIAEDFGVVMSTIGCIKRELYYAEVQCPGVNLNDLPKLRSRLSNDQIIEIKKMLIEKISYKVITKKFNVSETTISHIKTGKYYSKIQVPGMDLNDLSKSNRQLTDLQVIKIKKMLLEGFTQLNISKKINVSKNIIGSIKRGKTYKEIQIK